MAKILIYPNYSVSGLTELIRNSGHTPIYKTEAQFNLEYVKSIGNPGFGDDDVLLIICTLLDAHVLTTIVPSAKEINEAGYILTMGQTNYGATEEISLTYRLGLSKSIETGWSESALILVSNTIIKNPELISDGSIPIGRSISSCTELITPHLLVGNSATRGSPLVVVWEEGTNTLTGFKLRSPIIYFSFAWSFTYSYKWLLFFNDLLEYCKLIIRAPFVIKGNVRDLQNNPLTRDVVAYSTTDYKLVQKTTTDASGSYELKLPNNDKVSVMFIPFENEKPEVHFNVIPEENV